MSPILARALRARAHFTRPLRQFSTTPLCPQAIPSIPTTPTCPSPTCECAATPEGLDIDRKTPLLNTMAPYAEQVVLCTGQEDWHSNIEQEEGATGTFVKGIKSVIGKGGESFDPFNNILITASSLPTSPTPNTTSALLFPSFKQISSIPHTPIAYRAFTSAYLKATTLHPMHAGLIPDQKAALTRDTTLATNIPAAEDITNPVILICGHAGRDSRCGILGPILQHAFQTDLARRGINAQVAQISHIGGHKYAGNVIMYIPPSMAGNALAGMGIWYGRVGPENVEGLVEETVVRGRVVREFLRGGVLRGGGSLGRVVEKEEGGGVEEGLRLRPRARSGR